MCSSSFDKICVNVTCWMDTYGRYCFQINLQWTLSLITCISVFKIKISLFYFVWNKQTRPRFLVLADFITCFPHQKPRDIAFFPSVLKRVQRWRVLWIRSITTKRNKQRGSKSINYNLTKKREKPVFCERYVELII